MFKSIMPGKHRSKNGQKGFTIIEVLIAMGIFSIGILGVAAMQIASVKGNAAAQGVTDIAVLAADRLEKLMALPYNSNQIAAGTFSVGAGNLTLTTDGIDNDFDGLIDEAGETGPLTIEWTVVDDMPVRNSKTVTVTVQHVAPSVDKTVNITRVIPRVV